MDSILLQLEQSQAVLEYVCKHSQAFCILYLDQPHQDVVTTQGISKHLWDDDPLHIYYLLCEGLWSHGLIFSSHISEEEHLLLAVGHYLVFEVLQLEPEKEYTIRNQLQEEGGLENASQHFHLHYLQPLQFLLRTVQVVSVKEREIEILSELANQEVNHQISYERLNHLLCLLYSIQIGVAVQWKGDVTNFIQSYFYQFFNNSHGIKGYGKPSKRPFN